MSHLRLFIVLLLVGFAWAKTYCCYQCTGSQCEVGTCEGERCIKIYSEYKYGKSTFVQSKYGCASMELLQHLVGSSMIARSNQNDKDYCVRVVSKESKLSVPSIFKTFMEKYHSRTEVCVCNSDYCNSSVTVKSCMTAVAALMAFALL